MCRCRRRPGAPRGAPARTTPWRGGCLRPRAGACHAGAARSGVWKGRGGRGRPARGGAGAAHMAGDTPPDSFTGAAAAAARVDPRPESNLHGPRGACCTRGAIKCREGRAPAAAGGAGRARGGPQGGEGSRRPRGIWGIRRGGSRPSGRGVRAVMRQSGLRAGAGRGNPGARVRSGGAPPVAGAARARPRGCANQGRKKGGLPRGHALRCGAALSRRA
jgi:hypothetical protein